MIMVTINHYRYSVVRVYATYFIRQSAAVNVSVKLILRVL